jgi:hypothetical protein
MWTYEDIKKKFLEKKQPIVVGICFILVFIIGFGTGRFERQENRQSAKNQSYYTTKKDDSQAPQKNAKEEDAAQKGEKVLGEQTQKNNPVSSECVVKGNFSSSGKKIYHIKGGAFYNTVKPEQCFKTESEAKAAGFVKSSR